MTTRQRTGALAPSSQITLVGLFGGLIGVGYGFGIYLFAAIAPAMMEEFGFSYARMGVVTGLVQAGFLLFALASGFLTAMLGAFAVILWSLVLCVAALGGMMIAPNFAIVSVCLVVLGGCAASIWVPMVEVSQHFVDSKYQGRALGFMSSGTSYGVFANGIIIAALLATSGWRSVLATAFIIACGFLVCTILFFFRLRGRGNVSKNKSAQADAERIPLIKKVSVIANKDTAIVLLLMFFAGIACMPFQSTSLHF